MKVHLKKLTVNPFRDLKVDPIDKERVKILQQSIAEDGFWGGVVCRQIDDEIQIIAGHHRVKAAIAAGLKEADVLVKDIDDEAAVRIYSRENATHRGNQGTAQIGSVAAALRWIAREQLGTADFRRAENQWGVTQDGVGRQAILSLLKDVPGISRDTVDAQLTNLKASGAYTRIIEEVAAEIETECIEAEEEARRRAEEAAEAERKAQAEKDAEKKQKAEAASKKAAEDAAKAAKEAKDAEERAKKAEKAKAASKKHIRTFDLEGVRKLFQNDSQLNAFRNGVVKTYKIPVEKQRALAEKIVDAVDPSKLSADYITKKLKEFLDPSKKESIEIEKFIRQIMQPYKTQGGYPGQDLLSKCSELTLHLADVKPELLAELANFIEELFSRSKESSDRTVKLLRRGSSPSVRNVTPTRKLIGE